MTFNYLEYEKNSSIQTNKNINTTTYNRDYLSKILFLLNDMKLYVEKISYSNDGTISLDVRLLDKKNIYNFIDEIEKNYFKVISYEYTSEIEGFFIYTVRVEA